MSGLSEWGSSIGLDTELAEVLTVLTAACTRISGVLRTAPANGISGLASTTNVQGESQKPLDLISNEIFLDACRSLPAVSLAVSEEEDDLIPISQSGHYAVVFDPLDGSSNLDVNVTVGSIFSVVRARTEETLLAADQIQELAGFVSYGPATELIVTAKGRVARFVLNETGDWLLVTKNVALPNNYREVAINSARASTWDPVISGFIAQAFSGGEGGYNARWVGSLVAEASRILARGGLFVYPADSSTPGGKGRLRLLYEARPIAAIIEAAGGKCTDGRQPLKSLAATTLHDRVPLIFGGASQVEALQDAYRTLDGDEDFNSGT